MSQSLAALLLTITAAWGCATPPDAPSPDPPSPSDDSTIIDLPDPQLTSDMSLEQSLAERRSVRTWADRALTLEEISQLLWSAQGISHNNRYRTAPSAGALYPIEVYLVTATEMLHYLPEGHRAEQFETSGLIDALGETANRFIAAAAAIIVIAAVPARTEPKYRDRAERYVMLEAGHVCQNILLQVTALGLGAVPVGAFDDDAVKAALNLPADQHPLYLIPVGEPAI